MTESVSGPLSKLSRVALVVTVLDLVSKAIAAKLWTTSAVHLTPWLTLSVVPNHGGAFGWSAGAYTWQLNMALTLAAIVFIIPVTRDLAQVDKGSTAALGLIVGGALGNLTSLVLPPAGVLDFIGIHFSGSRGIVINIADIAAYSGLALLSRTGFRIVEALAGRARGESSASRTAATTVTRSGRRSRRPRIADQLVADWSLLRRTESLRAGAPPIDAPIEAPVSTPADVPKRSRLAEFSRRVQIDRPSRSTEIQVREP